VPCLRKDELVFMAVFAEDLSEVGVQQMEVDFEDIATGSIE
jgi:hypothetical protein